jgi:outer membrane lipoprotein-sorting protein
MKTTFGNVAVTGTLHVCGANYRQESLIQGRRQIIIAHGSILYILDPAKKTYRQGPATRPWSATEMTKEFAKGTTKTHLGKTKMNGVACEKYVYKAKRKDSGTGSIVLYAAENLDLAVRTEIVAGGKRTIVEFTNIKRRPSPASLFEIPKGYTEIKPPKQQ